MNLRAIRYTTALLVASCSIVLFQNCSSAFEAGGGAEFASSSSIGPIDLTAPVVSFSQAPPAIIGSTNVTAIFAANEQSTYECALDAAAFSSCVSPLNLTALTEAPHTLKIRAKDLAGNVSSDVTASFKVDLTAPALTLLTKPTTPTNVATASFTFSGSDDGVAIKTFSCQLDAQAAAACNAGNVNYTNLTEGPHTFKFTGQDSGGNMSAPVSYAWTVDFIPPTISLSQQPTNPSTSTSATFAFSAQDARTSVKALECQLDNAAFATCTSPKSLTGLAVGNHTFTIRVTDAAANQTLLATTWAINSVVTPTPTPTGTNPYPGLNPNPNRKSPNPGNWVNVTTQNLRNLASECGNMTYMAAKPNEDLVIAGIANAGLWKSTNGGQSWSPMGTGAGSAQITNRPTTIIFDPLHSDVFWESGIWKWPGLGLYRTDNKGTSFTNLGTYFDTAQRYGPDHNDSISVDFSDPNRQTLLAGGHEQYQTVYLSKDGGKNWSNIGGSLPNSASAGYSSFVLATNSNYFVGADENWGRGAPGIFQYQNNSWVKVFDRGGSIDPLVTGDGIIYWPSVDGSLVRGTPQGATWKWENVPSTAGILQGHQPVHPIQLPDGRLVSVGNNRIMISSDKNGNQWSPYGPAMPFAPVGITYSDADRSFYIWHFDCSNRVPADAMMKLWLE